jgi:hypothetical protein
MHESESWKIEGTYEEIGWLIGCSPEIVARCVIELKRHETADVTLGNGFVTVLSRRMQRELKAKENNTLRVRKHRGNADVTPMSHDRVKSKSKEKEEREEDSTALAIHSAKALSGVLSTLRLQRFGPTEERDWLQYIALAFENGFTAEDFIECHAERVAKSPGYTVKPAWVSENLPAFVKSRKARKVAVLPSFEQLAADREANDNAVRRMHEVERVQ